MSNSTSKSAKPKSSEPVGKGDYVVQEGDCISSIAEAAGHFWETLWNDPANADLKKERKDPNILMPGDRVTVMPLRAKEESCADKQKHRFKRKGVPSKLCLRLLKEGKPRANEDYRIDVDGKVDTGKTDGDGRLTVSIPGTAKQAILFVGKAGEEDEYELNLGVTYPITHAIGVQQRLKNLGYYNGKTDGEWTDLCRSAVFDFQVAEELKPTGELNDETRDKLEEVYGS